MPSIRDQIQTALVARLATITGWSAQLRGSTNTAPETGVLAVVAFLGEDKQLATSSPPLYDASLHLLVWVCVDGHEADAVTDGGNPFRYLDRMVVLAEQKIHAPDAWGVDPDFTDVRVLGHEVSDPTDDLRLFAELRLTFTYRHTAENPEV